MLITYSNWWFKLTCSNCEKNHSPRNLLKLLIIYINQNMVPMCQDCNTSFDILHRTPGLQWISTLILYYSFNCDIWYTVVISRSLVIHWPWNPGNIPSCLLIYFIYSNTQISQFPGRKQHDQTINMLSQPYHTGKEEED